MTQKDEALEVLIEIFGKGKYSFTEDLLRGCYKIQKQYQFDKDRDLPVEHMRRLVEADVAVQLSETQKGAR